MVVQANTRILETCATHYEEHLGVLVEWQFFLVTAHGNSGAKG